MDTKELREKIGPRKFDEIVDYVKQLRAQGKDPDEIGEALKSRFPDAVTPLLAIIFIGFAPAR